MLQLSLKAEVAKLENEKAAFVYKNNLDHLSDTIDYRMQLVKAKLIIDS